MLLMHRSAASTGEPIVASMNAMSGKCCAFSPRG